MLYWVCISWCSFKYFAPRSLWKKCK